MVKSLMLHILAGLAEIGGKIITWWCCVSKRDDGNNRSVSRG